MLGRLQRLAALACAALLPACATAVVAVAPGHAALLTRPDGSLAQLDEGVAEIPPGSQVDDFDLTEQAQGGSFTSLTADGVPVVVRDPIVSYRLVAPELLDADRAVGPGGWRALIAPIVQSTIGGVLASYRWDQLDPARLRQAQARITALSAARLRPYHVALSSVELKGVTPRLPAFARAITDTSIWEQRSAAARSRLEVARQRADGLREKAAGVAAANARIAPTLTDAVLAEQSNQAWRRLITSPRTTVQVAPTTALEVSP